VTEEARTVTGFVGRGRYDVVTAGELTSVEDHLAALLSLLPRPDPIELRLLDAVGLVLAEDVVSHVSLPAFPNSAMDGYALVASDIADASVEQPAHLPVVGEVVAGASDVPNVSPGRCVRIMTGAPLPVGADVVVPVETTSGGQGQVAFHRPYPAGANVRRVGEDLAPGQPLVAAGRRITPADVALLANAGETRVPCNPPPRVVVLSTGDELVPAHVTPGPGQIRDGNGPMVAALVRQAGGTPFSGGIVRDDRKALMYALDTNLGHADLVVCTGGASAGTRDLLPDVIGALGEVQASKVAMQPGMPQILGRVRDVPVVGLPGNPVSAFVSFEVFVRPALRTMQGRRDVDRPRIRAEVTSPLSSPPDKRSFLRVRLAHADGRWTAAPTGAQGSHLVSSIALADGLAVVPEDVTEVPTGAQVDVQLLVD
jgi:molybdopterin molybdotransferase